MGMSNNERKYYNADKLITHNALYEFILSARNSGKTFYLSQLKRETSEKKAVKRKGR